MAQTNQGAAVAIICNAFQVAKQIVGAIGFGIAVIIIMVSGIKYMAAAGNPEKLDNARTGVIRALIGVAIITGSIFLIGLAQGVVTEVGGVNLLASPCPQLLTL